MNKEQEDHLIKCPLCKGLGTVTATSQDVKAETIYNMHKEGMSYRNIAKVFKIKSASTIFYHIKKHERNN